MKTFALTILASLLAVTSAVPVNGDDGGNAAAAPAPTTTPPAVGSQCTVIFSTVLAPAAATATVAAAAATGTSKNGTSTNGGTGTNVQTFTGTLGGPPPPVISSTGDRPFSVNGDTFVGEKAALGRSCDVQHNACANAANSGKLSGGVQQCDEQNTQCHEANNLKKRHHRDVRPTLPKRAAPDLGSCSNANILFESGLDGRTTESFLAANQEDFNHGSVLNIAVVAGFICQRLGSPCNAPADVQESCTQASAAAVATTQNQAAADAWNAIMGDGSVGGGAAAAPAITPAPQASAASGAGVQVLTITQCS